MVCKQFFLTHQASLLRCLIAQVARILSDGLKQVHNRHSDGRHLSSGKQASPPSALPSAAARVPEKDDVKSLPFEVFLRACNIYFCFQVGVDRVEARSQGKV